ncbi:GIY-YIG nuclease family protein [Clostridium botulinum]|nr:GIY-YIG nuclease family protein [Clostridium botulinum]
MGVYIILNRTRSNDKELIIKIGCSKNIHNRFKQIKKGFIFNGIKDELEIMQIIKCSKYRLLEKHLHQIMNSKKLINKYGNEWFKTDEDFLNRALMRIDLNYYK